MQALEYIADSEKVIEALGCWPTFHDAELVSFQAERALPVKASNSVARFAIHVRQYETIGEGTASYEQVLRRSVLIRFVLNDASDFELSGFNHQNVINSLTASPMQGNEIARLSVEIESTWGLEATFNVHRLWSRQWKFFKMPPPNPSIERDVQGLSPSAAPHVKR